MSKTTKKYKIGYIITAIISWIAFIGPTIYFVATAFIGSNLAVEKVALATSILVVLVLSGIAFVNKVALRSRLWIVMLGLYYVLPTIELAILTIGIGQILHELIFEPIKKYYKQRYIINKEIDKRDNV